MWKRTTFLKPHHKLLNKYLLLHEMNMTGQSVITRKCCDMNKSRRIRRVFLNRKQYDTIKYLKVTFSTPRDQIEMWIKHALLIAVVVSIHVLVTPRIMLDMLSFHETGWYWLCSLYKTGGHSLLAFISNAFMLNLEIYILLWNGVCDTSN